MCRCLVLWRRFRATSDEEAEDLYKAVLAPGVSKYFAEMREQVREQQRLSEEPTEKKQDKSVGSEKSKTAAYTTSQDIRLRAFFIESVKTQIVPRKHNAEGTALNHVYIQYYLFIVINCDP
jgi:hypothetical protein